MMEVYNVKLDPEIKSKWIDLINQIKEEYDLTKLGDVYPLLIKVIEESIAQETPALKSYLEAIDQSLTSIHRTVMAVSDRFKDQQSDFQQELENLEKVNEEKRAGLTEQLNELVAQKNEAVNLNKQKQTEIEELQDKENQLLTENTKLRERVEYFESEKRSLTGLYEEFSLIKKKSDESEELNRKLIEDNESLKITNVELNQKVQQVQEDLEAANNALSNKEKEYQNKTEEFQNSISELEKKNEEILKSNQNLKIDKNQLKNQLERLNESAVNQIESIKVNQENEIKHLQERKELELANLKAQIENIKAEKDQEINNLSRQIEYYRRENRRFIDWFLSRDQEEVEEIETLENQMTIEDYIEKDKKED